MLGWIGVGGHYRRIWNCQSPMWNQCLKFLRCSMYCLFCDILCTVCKCVLYYCHWVATQLQLTNISYHKWRLQTYCLDSFLACCALQGMPSLSAYGWALFKNWTTKNIKMKLLSLWLVPYITFSLLGYFQNVSSMLLSRPLLQDTPIHL
jgi:hypothetical protein